MTKADSSGTLWTWLDTIGLPWRSTRAELIAQFGLQTHNPYDWPIVSIDLAPAPLSGMMWPFGFQEFGPFPKAFPPVRFSTAVWFEDDARANVRRTAQELAVGLGGQLPEQQYNTISAEWHFGAASLRLIGWPADLQGGLSGSNPAHQREPRLAHACQVELDTGWRQPISEQDLRWLDEIEPLVGDRGLPLGAQLSPLWSAEGVLPYLRTIPDDRQHLRGTIGVTRGKDALIFCSNGLHIVPVADITLVECSRLLPAKGGGGSSLLLKCGPRTSDWPHQWISLVQGNRADDLNRFGEALAAALGVPFDLRPYDYDT